nr:outer membrane protein assembly factor [Thermotoga sp. SG1]
MKRKTMVVLVIVFLAVSSMAVYISDVKFEGLNVLTPDFITQKVGKLFGEVTSDEIQDYLKKIFDLGYFSSLTPSLEPSDVGYRLIVTLKENPTVSDWKLEVEGPGLVDRKEIEKVVKIEKDKPLNTNSLRETFEAIRNRYQEAGYFLVEINGSFENGTYKIVVKEYALWDIVFNGETDGLDIVSILSKAKIKTLRDYYASSPLVRFFTMSKKDFYPTLSEMNKLISVLNSYPFFSRETSVDFKKTTVKDIEEKNVVIMVVNVVQRRIFEGEKKFKEILFHGNTIFTDQELLRASGLFPNETYTNSQILLAMNRLVDFYERNNYPYIWIEARVEDDRLVFDVYEKYVRSVKIEGLKRTRPYVVENLITIKEGEPLNKEEIMLTYSYLQNSRYFDSVNIYPQLSQNATQVDVVVDLKEAEKTRNFIGGLGWTMPKEGEWWQGFSGTVQLSAVNSFGYGESFSIDLSLGFIERSVEGTVKLPIKLDVPMNLELGAGYTNYATSSGTDTVSLKGIVSTLPYKGHSFGVGALYEKELVEDSKGTLAALFKYRYNTKNSAVLPTEGYYLSLDLTRAGLFGLDDQKYWKGILTGEAYYPIFESLYWSFKGTGGLVYNEIGTELLEVSGPYTVRGYDYFETEKMFKLSADLNWILQRENVPVVTGVFFDYGGIEEDGNMKLLSSAGVKLDLVIPLLGSVEVGGAYRFNEKNWQLYFFMGGW